MVVRKASAQYAASGLDTRDGGLGIPLKKDICAKIVTARLTSIMNLTWWPLHALAVDPVRH